MRLHPYLILLAGFVLYAATPNMASGPEDSSSSPKSADCPALPSDAIMVFEDHFDRQKLDSFEAGNIEQSVRDRLNWIVLNGSWEIRHDADGNGYLFGKGGPGTILIDKPLGRNVRLEYTAWSSNPGDRSAVLSIPKPNLTFDALYRFHVAANYSKNHCIMKRSAPVGPQIFSPLPSAGQRFRIVIQIINNQLEMYIDGKQIISTVDKDYQQTKDELFSGFFAGFYTWSDGVCFDDVKLFELPGPVQLRIPADEIKPETHLWIGFDEKQNAHDKPVNNVNTVGHVNRVDVPTVVYRPYPHGQTLEADYCLRMKGDRQSESMNQIVCEFKPIDSGEIEVELMAYQHGQQYTSIALIDSNRNSLAKLIIDSEGRFFSESPKKGMIRLRDKINYPNRPEGAPFRLQPYRWFTIRFTFDTKQRLWQASIVNLYKSFIGNRGISYLPISDALPMSGNQPVCGISIQSGNKTDLFIDNICMSSPLAKLINGIDHTAPLRDILGLDYPLRKDPVKLTTQWLRNEYSYFHRNDEQIKQRYALLPTPRFIKAAHKYNDLLVQQALLEEKWNVLSRMLFYQRESNSAGIDQRAISKCHRAVNDSKEDLDQLLQVYGNSFRDHLNERMLDDAFDPLATQLGTKIEKTDILVTQYQNKLYQNAGIKISTQQKTDLPSKIKWQNGQFVRDEKPSMLISPYVPYAFYPYQKGSHHEQSRKRLPGWLGFDNCLNTPYILDNYLHPDENKTFGWELFDQYVEDYVNPIDPASSFCVFSGYGLVYLNQHCPAWWLEKNKDDPDIFFAGADGKNATIKGFETPYQPRAYVGSGLFTGGYKALLNFWNPRVRKMYQEMLTQWSKRMSEKYPSRTMYFLVGWEGNNWGGVMTGLNPSAIKQFREYLIGIYKEIEQLNHAWNSAYKSFDDIDPRDRDSATPNGLLYEFSRFRQKGYWDWMDLMAKSLKTYLPDLVILNDFHNAGDLPLYGGLHEPDMFEHYDLVGTHYFGKPATEAVANNRRLDSLKKVYKKPIGSFEWSIEIRTPDLFDENAFKTGGLVEMFEQLSWGKSALCAWYDTQPGFDDGGSFWIGPLAHTVLRYSSGAYSVGRQRASKFEGIALSCPTVRPELAILRPTSSFYNNIDCRPMRMMTAELLSEHNIEYEILYEDLVSNGKQNLEGIKTIIVPKGICLENTVSTKLLKWVKEGGTLIALMPPGIYNQYGQPSEVLCKTILGTENFKLNQNMTTATSTSAKYSGASVIARNYQKGRLVVFMEVEPFPSKELLAEIIKTLKPLFRAANGRFRIVARESAEYLYLFIINFDLYESHEDEVIVDASYSNPTDLGCPVPFPVPEDTNKTCRFQLRLAPGEGTVIRLNK